MSCELSSGVSLGCGLQLQSAGTFKNDRTRGIFEKLESWHWAILLTAHAKGPGRCPLLISIIYVFVSCSRPGDSGVM